MIGPFALYPVEQAWWSFRDYASVLDVMVETRARSVVEFGPGSSTLALIEGGATQIDTCEDEPEWADVHAERIVQRFPQIVRLHRYQWSQPLIVPALVGRHFDLALIDGPRDLERRPEVLRFLLRFCAWVLMPTEEGHAEPWLRPIIGAMAAEAGRVVTFRQTGPLSGAFALVAPPC